MYGDSHSGQRKGVSGTVKEVCWNVKQKYWGKTLSIYRFKKPQKSFKSFINLYIRMEVCGKKNVLTQYFQCLISPDFPSSCYVKLFVVVVLILRVSSAIIGTLTDLLILPSSS